MLIGAHDEPTPAIDATVSLKGAGNPAQTKQGGEFRLSLPDIYKPGEDITLIVEIGGYRVFRPVGGETKVPADLDKQVIDIQLLPEGSKRFLSDAEIEYRIKTAAEESKAQVKPGEGSRPVDFTVYFKEWADQYGLSEEVAMQAIRKWIAQVQQESDDPHKLGLAAFAEKNFRKARELFTQSGENNEKTLRRQGRRLSATSAWRGTRPITIIGSGRPWPAINAPSSTPPRSKPRRFGRRCSSILETLNGPWGSVPMERISISAWPRPSRPTGQRSRSAPARACRWTGPRPRTTWGMH